VDIKLLVERRLKRSNSLNRSGSQATKARFTQGKVGLSEWMKTEQVSSNDKASDLDTESCQFECRQGDRLPELRFL
jgi:hypothetical protein